MLNSVAVSLKVFMHLCVHCQNKINPNEHYMINMFNKLTGQQRLHPQASKKKNLIRIQANYWIFFLH